MTKVFWKPEELLAVLLQAGKLIESGEEVAMGQALVRAQRMALVPSRHRSELSLKSAVTDFKPKIAQAMAAEKQRVAKETLEKVAISASENKRKEKEQSDLADRLNAEDKEEQDAEERAKTRAISDSTSISLPSNNDVTDHNRMIQPDFIGSICRSIGAQFEKALVAELTAAFERAHTRVAQTGRAKVMPFEEIPTIKLNRPKVVIAGFKSHLNHELYDEFSEFLDMTFFDADAQPRQLSQAASRADHVLLIKKFVGHNLREAVDHHPGFLLVQGSISSTKNVLLELASKPDLT
jgi:hypothetical protein